MIPRRSGQGRVARVRLLLGGLAALGASAPLRAEPLAVVFGGADVGGSSAHISAGFKLGPLGGLDATGFRVVGLAGGELRGGSDGRKASAALLAGREWIVPGGPILLLAAGPDWATRPDKQGFGVRGLADVWWHPSDGRLVQASLSASTSERSAYARVAYGWRVLDGPWGHVHVGPEASGSLEPRYRKLRLGAHATGLRLGPVETRLSLGWQLETKDAAEPRRPDESSSGFYAALAAWSRF